MFLLDFLADRRTRFSGRSEQESERWKGLPYCREVCRTEVIIPDTSRVFVTALSMVCQWVVIAFEKAPPPPFLRATHDTYFLLLCCKSASLICAERTRPGSTGGQWEWRGKTDAMAHSFMNAGFDIQHPRTVKYLELSMRIQDLPRNLSQYSGGMVTCQGRLNLCSLNAAA